MKRLSCLSMCLLVAACATNAPQGGVAVPSDRANLPYSSPECLAKKLKPVDPFPVNEIPATALAGHKSGWVAIRYDVVSGAAQNLVIVGSDGSGLYDAPAMRHVARYRDATKSTVGACVTMIDVKF